MEPGHLLHSALSCPSSRHPSVPAAQQLIILSHNNIVRAAHWADHRWNAELLDNPTKLHIFIPDTGTQARNQLGTPGGAKSFPRVAKIF